MTYLIILNVILGLTLLWLAYRQLLLDAALGNALEVLDKHRHLFPAQEAPHETTGPMLTHTNISDDYDPIAVRVARPLYLVPPKKPI